MKRDQLVDMIGHAPDAYVKDAKDAPGKRRMSRRIQWLGGIAAVLAVALVFNMPAIPMVITAKAVSEPTASRRMTRDDFQGERFDYEGYEQMVAARDAILDEAVPPLAAFTGECASYVLSGTDSENRLFSPINAYIGLAMTAELVGGNAQNQLLDVLGAPSEDVLRTRISTVWEQVEDTRNGSERCTIANALWLDRDVRYVQETMDDIAYHYYASVYEGDLGSSRTERDMNAWMKNNSGGMIQKRQSPEIKPEDQLLTLTSAIYFRSKWRDEFNASQNTTKTFHAYDGDITCTFMNKQQAHMYYFWEEDFGAVCMSLKNGSTMWFLLPDEDKTVNDVLDGADFVDVITRSDYYSEESTNSKYMKVNLSVPQFDVSSSADLKEALQAMGVTDIFDPDSADFSPSIVSTPEKPPYITAVNQDVRVKIDEKGVTAAAYIEIPGAGAAAPPEEIIDFILDRPFVFAVTKSQIPLFVGVVNRP